MNRTLTNRFPLLRFDNEKWLKEYAKGHIFLRNLLYYQSMEEIDAARFDPFDGALPVSAPNLFTEYQQDSNIEIKHLRLMNPNIFVGCLFSYDMNNVRHTECGQTVIHLSDENVKAAKEFAKDSVLVIFDRVEFERRITEAINRNGVKCLHHKVFYKDYSDRKAIGVLENEFISGQRAREEIPFIKDIRFRFQQEYRICCEYQNSIADSLADEYIKLEREVKEQTRFFEINSIEDISRIIPFDVFLESLYQLLED